MFSDADVGWCVATYMLAGGSVDGSAIEVVRKLSVPSDT